MHEIDNIVGNPERYNTMVTRAKAFFKDDAAREIAIEAVKIGLEHEK